MEKSPIWKTRVAKEKEMLIKVQNTKISAEFLENDENLLLNFDVSGYSVSILLEFTPRYPFDPPELKLVSSYGLESLTDINQSDSALEMILCENWVPVKSLNDIVEALGLYVQQSYKPLEKSLILDVFNVKPKFRLPLLVLFVLILRIFVINMPQMDWNNPLAFGPYEAVRSEMSLVVNLEVSKWYLNEGYQEINNPPLCAFFLAGLARVGWVVDEDGLSLMAVPGYQSTEQKIFMRLSVLIFEFLVLFSAVFEFFRVFFRNLSVNVRVVGCGLVMVSPTVILIQHVFFSFNGISVGLLLWSVLMVFKEKFCVACIVLSLSLGFSIENLPLLIVALLFILTKAIKVSKKRSQKVHSHKTLVFISESILLTTLCILSFFLPLCLLISPWFQTNTLLQLFRSESITLYKTPTLIKKLSTLLTLSLTSTVTLQLALIFLFLAPLLYIYTKSLTSDRKIFCTFLCTGFTFTLFSQSSNQSHLFTLTLFFSLFTIIEAPEVFRFCSILTSFILYPQTIQDGSRFGYFLLTTLFFLLTQHYISTVNYLQNRSSRSLILLYVDLLLIHLTEAFYPTIFPFLHQFFSYFSLLGLYFWVLYSACSPKSPSHSFYTEKRFSNKNKNT